jgi:hypothetical protein
MRVILLMPSDTPLPTLPTEIAVGDVHPAQSERAALDVVASH